MRLICPNCAAQYEVDASLLPEDGTEVQCSSCDTVWFHPGGASAKPPVRQSRQPERQPTRAAPGPEATPPADPAPPPAPVPHPARPEVAPSDTPGQSAQQPAPHPAPATAESTQADPPARALDPAVADVLRSEAEFEARQRAREENALEMQQELGLLGPALSAPVSQSSASRLPDIDVISATLEPVDTDRGSQPELPRTEAARKRSFLSGLLVPLVIAVLLAGLYVLAPELVGAVPALEAIVTDYVSMVDKARLAIADLLGAGS